MAGLPDRGSYCIRGAYVITMDESIGDIVDGHVHVVDGALTQVEPDHGCDQAATALDGRGRVVLPGFVDTHWHLWVALFRGLVGHESGQDYWAAKDRLGVRYRPIDSKRAARLVLAEGLKAGFTTIHNWNHNTRSPEDADANVEAQRELGVRSRFSYGPKQEQKRGETMDLADAARIQAAIEQSGDDLVTLGLQVRSHAMADPDTYRAEWRFAREHGLPMTFHCGGLRSETHRYADLMQMNAEGLMGPDVLVVHAVHANAEEIRMLADTGTHLSLCPVTQVRSMGAPPLTELLDAGVQVSLSIDNLANPTPGDMFLQMRGTYSIEKMRKPDTTLNARRLLQLATIDGARGLGLESVTGSLVPGKRADLLVIDTNDVNLAPCANPVEQIVMAARPDNVEYVVVDGRVLVDHGRFTHVDDAALVDDARDSQEFLIAAAGWEVDHWANPPRRKAS